MYSIHLQNISRTGSPPRSDTGRANAVLSGDDMFRLKTANEDIKIITGK